MAIKKGARVTWTSNSGGIVREKTGVVLMVVPTKTRLTPKDIIPFSNEYSINDLARQLTQTSGVRLNESYIIGVESENRRAKRRLYWPHEHQVTRVPKTQNKESEACQESTQSPS